MRKLLAIQPRHPKALETLGLAAAPVASRQSSAGKLASSGQPTPAKKQAASSVIKRARTVQMPAEQAMHAAIASGPPFPVPESGPAA